MFATNKTRPSKIRPEHLCCGSTKNPRSSQKPFITDLTHPFDEPLRK